MRECYVYAFALATAFVLNLYLLVPSSVSKLPRNNERHIKFRMISVLVTCLIGILSHHYIFCRTFNGIDVFDMQMNELFFAPVKHVSVLYLGSFVSSALESHVIFHSHSCSMSYSKFMYNQISTKLTEPFRNSRFQVARDLIIAPFAEELIFRSLTISPMLYSREYLEGTVRISTICVTTPLFFGLAHVHHAYTKIKHDKVPVSKALMSSGFQFIYTYLFGAYASFCYVKIKSLMSVCLVHSLCNYLSLPNIAIFLVETRSRQNTRAYYAIVGLMYVVGIFLFYLGFHSLFAFENESFHETF